MLDWLKSIFSRPKPSGPPEMIRRFGPMDRLFEVHDPQVEQCVIAYRASIKTDGLSGRAFLEMWCRLTGHGEFFSKGFDQAVKGTTDWSSHEVPFYLKKGQRPDLIKLNIVVQGQGKVWIKDVQLLKTPLSS